MAIIQEVLDAKLLAYAPLTAIVGDRIYPKRAPQGVTQPFVIYQRVGGPVDGISMGNAKAWDKPRIQVSCFATGYTATARLAQVVRAALRTMVDPASDPPIDNIEIESQGPELYEEDTKLHHHPVDATVTYRE
jgi:uncharacterized protein DUF3168